MKTIAIVGRDPAHVQELKRQLAGFEYDDVHPDFVVSFGGDGTYLVSERLYPGIPKLVIQHGGSVCAKCVEGNAHHLVTHVLKGECTIKENLKIEASLPGRVVTCTNDFVLRNKLPTHAIRFRVWVGDGAKSDIIIGDGVVVSTPFGSSGYYRSITRSTFAEGIGVAFNNTTEPCNPLVLPGDAVLHIEVVRGVGLCAADNDPEISKANEGAVLSVKRSFNVARILSIHGHTADVTL